ncbi:MAG: hypothetical protein ACC652_04820 [Acidimicrobiales bacterium]
MSEEPMKLHPRFEAAIPPGHYECTLSPGLEADELAQGGTTVPSGNAIPPRVVHIEVEGPRYSMDPGELFGAFPPANAIGPFAARLPQAVLRRRTLPWERSSAAEPAVPWLALVVLADAEATFHANIDPADAYTPGRIPLEVAALPTGLGGADAIEVSETVINRAFPAKSELHLLCHAREIDPESSEFGSSNYVDEDGVVSVVLANRLPLPGTSYGVYLISLEGQHDALRANGGPSQSTVPFDWVFEGMIAAEDMPRIAKAVEDEPGRSQPGTDAQQITNIGYSAQFVIQNVDWLALGDLLGAKVPTFRFPVLAHWSFACSDEAGDFSGYMKGLDVGLFGTIRTDPSEPDRNVGVTTPTGHLQVKHVNRRGEGAKSWYRGPFAPARMTRNLARPMAHISDQALKAVAEGSLDLSLASAFEVGRLLAMSDPTFVRNQRAWARNRYSITNLIESVEPALGAYLDQFLARPRETVEDPLIGAAIIGELFGGQPTDPWDPDLVERFLDETLPAVAIHDAVRLTDDLDVAGVAAGLSASVVASDTFEDLKRKSDLGFTSAQFAQTRRVDIDRRELIAEVFTGLAAEGFEIQNLSTGLVAEIRPELGNINSALTPRLIEILGEPGAAIPLFERGGEKPVDGPLIRRGGG